MTQARRSTMDMLDDRANAGFYAATLGACVAFAVMLFAPDDHADAFLALACGCMAVSVLFLAGKLWIAVVAGRGRIDGSGPVDI